MTPETIIALAALACIATFFLGGTLVWLIVEPLLRESAKQVREAKRAVAVAEGLERLFAWTPDKFDRSHTLAPGTVVTSHAAHTSPEPTLKAVE